MTDDHVRALYSGTPLEYVLYDSAKLGQVLNFATSPQIQIMAVTVGAINKQNVNNLYKDSETTGGEKPIRSYQGHPAGPDRGRAPECRWRFEGAGQGGSRRDELALHTP